MDTPGDHTAPSIFETSTPHAFLDWLYQDPLRVKRAHLVASRGIRKHPGCEYSEAAEVIDEAAQRILEGERHLDFQTEKEALVFFLGVIKSLIYHADRKAKRRNEVPMSGGESDEESNESEPVDPEKLGEEEMHVIERIHLKERIAGIHDPLLRANATLLGCGFSAEERSVKLGLTVTEIRSLDKRTRRS